MTTTQTTKLTWQTVGRWSGGTVAGVALRRDPHGVVQGLAASRAGALVWRSDGDGWTRAVQGLSDPSVLAVTFAGGQDRPAATAWAATATGRLYFADDAGTAWCEATAWAGLGVGMVLAASPTFDQDATLFVGTPSGIYRTLDGGASWENCDFGLLDTETLCLACAPDFAESQIVWAGTAGGGLYRSRNGGRAWRESGIGLADAPVQALSVSPNFSEDRSLYAALEGAGVYRSEDGGASWSPWLDGLGDAQVNTVVCAEGGVVYAGCDLGVFRRGATAESWELLADLPEAVLALDTVGDVMVAGMYLGGPAVSPDRGATWTASELALRMPPLVTCATPSTWMAADGDGELALTEDGGATWRGVVPVADTALFGLAGAKGPGGGARFWAATAVGLFCYDVVDGNTQATPVEAVGDKLWPGETDQPVFGVEVASPDLGATQMLVTGLEGAILHSADGGVSWRDVTGPWRGQSVLRASLTAQAEPGGQTLPTLHVLTAQANDDGNFAVELWDSMDQGETWQSLAQLTSGIPAVLTAWPTDPTHPTTFLATQHRVVKLHRADGEWAVHQHFFAEATRVTALVASPDYAADGTLFAATSDGLACSRDRGETWAWVADLPDGLPVVWMALDDGKLAAVTLGGDVWRTEPDG